MSSSIQFILCDIEGTITDIAFVKEVLFPYARQHIADFIRTNQQNLKVKEQIQLVAQHLNMNDISVDDCITQLLEWIDQDQKVTPLKTLQGMIWVAGYQTAAFTGHLYPDAHQNLLRWHSQNIPLGIFSSGSIKAQKLLLGYSDFGDLTSWFSAYFDTNVGHKRQTLAYRTIASQIKQDPASILFLSDIAEELQAAQTIGMQVCEIRRDYLPSQSSFPTAHTLDEVSIQFGL
jgi:enolase-phosphatase E1